MLQWICPVETSSNKLEKSFWPFTFWINSSRALYLFELQSLILYKLFLIIRSTFFSQWVRTIFKTKYHFLLSSRKTKYLPLYLLIFVFSHFFLYLFAININGDKNNHNSTVYSLPDYKIAQELSFIESPKYKKCNNFKIWIENFSTPANESLNSIHKYTLPQVICNSHY